MMRENPEPAYPEYPEVLAEARRTAPRFLDAGDLTKFSEVIQRRGFDWCTGVIGYAFHELRQISKLEAQMLVVADLMRLDPPLPAPIVEARARHDEYQRRLQEARDAQDARDLAAWQTAKAACVVAVEVWANSRGRRYSVVMPEPLRHTVPKVDAMSGRGRRHKAGRPLCETPGRVKPIRLADSPSDKPATCKSCLAHMPNVLPAVEEAGK